MSEIRDYLEQNPELENLTPEELNLHLEDQALRGEAAWENEKEMENAVEEDRKEEIEEKVAELEDLDLNGRVGDMAEKIHNHVKNI